MEIETRKMKRSDKNYYPTTISFARAASSKLCRTIAKIDFDPYFIPEKHLVFIAKTCLGDDKFDFQGDVLECLTKIGDFVNNCEDALADIESLNNIVYRTEYIIESVSDVCSSKLYPLTICLRRGHFTHRIKFERIPLDTQDVADIFEMLAKAKNPDIAEIKIKNITGTY